MLFTKTLLIFFLAGIPSPVFFGALIDTTCMKWGTKSCGGEGACRIYDIVKYRYIFCFILISLPCCIIKYIQVQLYALLIFLVDKLFLCYEFDKPHFFGVGFICLVQPLSQMLECPLARNSLVP